MSVYVRELKGYYPMGIRPAHHPKSFSHQNEGFARSCQPQLPSYALNSGGVSFDGAR